MEVVYLPNTMKAMGCCPCVYCDFLYPPVFKQKQDGLPGESHVSRHQSFLTRRRYFSNPCFTSGWRTQRLFYHIDPHHTAELPHKWNGSKQPRANTVSLQIPQTWATRWVYAKQALGSWRYINAIWTREKMKTGKLCVPYWQCFYLIL